MSSWFFWNCMKRYTWLIETHQNYLLHHKQMYLLTKENGKAKWWCILLSIWTKTLYCVDYQMVNILDKPQFITNVVSLWWIGGSIVKRNWLKLTEDSERISQIISAKQRLRSTAMYCAVTEGANTKEYTEYCSKLQKYTQY